MENILKELEGKKCWKSFLKTQCRRNKISPHLVGSFTLIKFRKFYEKLSHTYL
jgi:ribosomal protein S19